MREGASAGAEPVRVGLFGCPLDTGNLGVSALGISSVRGLTTRNAAVDCTLFDYGRGRRTSTLRGESWSATVELVPCAYSRRYYRPGNLQQLHLAARLGLSRVHPLLAQIDRMRGILDISGGDSFSDLYGDWRYRAVAMPKRLALALRKPLILLPQTLGPFREVSNRADAQELMRGARQVWTRDAASLDLARALLGADFDPARHRLGVDVAFGLPVCEPPPSEWTDSLQRFLDAGERVVGLNVSGLLFNRPDAGRKEFGLRASYRDLVRRVVDRLLAVPGTRILLVPHVVPPCLPEESDDAAHRDVVAALDADQRAAVFRVPPDLEATEAKWVIGRCDWFCGTRMHACIAALSQGVPTLGLAYSDKAEGVFASVGAGDWVIDTRTVELEALVERVVSTLPEAEKKARVIREHLPGVRDQLAQQFAEILAALSPAPGRAGATR